MFKLMGAIFKFFLLALIVLAASNLLQWNGKTLNQRFETALAMFRGSTPIKNFGSYLQKQAPGRSEIKGIVVDQIPESEKTKLKEFLRSFEVQGKSKQAPSAEHRSN